MIGQTIGSGAYRFKIDRELGSGAMGTVYRATFFKNDEKKLVALKFVALGLLGNESAMARFDREASILKQLRHKHIVHLEAVGRYQKQPFIAMEFIDGEALDRVLARRGKLTWEAVVAHAKQLCEALQYAHDKGIIHRDLKPSNLMITTDGTLKLTDFGIAKDMDVTALTGAQSTIGTAAYMSPEQCKGDKHLTNKSDLYSLGIVLFELLTGRKPFIAETTVDMFLKHVNEPPPRLGKLVPEMPQKLEGLILQLMEKDKDQRPMDAAWVVRMLAEVEDDQFARKSAGLDAVNSRRVDRRGDAPVLDEADRDAARALKGIKKKKKKKRYLPWHQRKWVKASVLSGLLLAIVLGVWLATRPPSAEKLAAQIDKAETDPERLAAAEKYLEIYGDAPCEATDRAARVFRDAKVRERERQLSRRYGVAKWRDAPEEKDDPTAYQLAMSAIQAEKDGRLANARNLWTQVQAVFPDQAKLPHPFMGGSLNDDSLRKALWGWLGEQRIRDVDDVAKRQAELDRSIAEDRNIEKPIAFDPSSARSLAIRARRLEKIGDPDKAARTWETLIDLPDNEPDTGALQLLAGEHRAQLKDKRINRPLFVRGLVDSAEKRLHALQMNKLATAIEWKILRADCRDIVELYGDEADKAIADSVARAKSVVSQAKG
ncbi:MAG TPA: protein kinase [Urbifossiella sp.]|nr:protein kinase [Urbifossiella sp.]